MKKVIEKYWYIFAGIHFVISCIVSADFFTKEAFKSTMGTIDMAPEYTEEMLRIISTCLTKAIAFLFVLGFWYLIRCLVQKKIKTKIIGAFLVVSVILDLYILRVYPGVYGIEIDNFIIFQYAIRQLPYYWHGVITSAVYGAAYTVIPHVSAVPLLQCNLFLGVVFWCYEKLHKTTNNKWTKLIFILLLLPEAFEVLMSPYRNCMYTIISLWGVAYILFAIHEKEKKIEWYVPVLFAVIAAWRTEGILIGAGLFILLQILMYQDKKRLIATVALFAVCFMCLNKVQGIGSEKHYGNDYLFVSTMAPLNMILNQRDANLSYAGVESDLAAIEAITPVEWIKCAGLGGFRAYNHALGREINQSCATQEQQGAYLKAYARIVLHNLDTFLVCQLSNTLRANGTTYPFEYDIYAGWPIEMPGDVYLNVGNMWNNGALEFQEYGDVVITEVQPTTEPFYKCYKNIWEMTEVSVVLRFVAALYMVYMCISELGIFLKEKRIENAVKVLVPLFLLGQLAIIILTIPEARPQYFYPVYYQMLVVMLYHCLMKKQIVKN